MNKYLIHNYVSSIQVVKNYLITTSEDGNIYRYIWKTGKLDKIFSHHKKTVTSFCVHNNESIYSSSIDGTIKNFDLEEFTTEIKSFELTEPLQTIELAWETLFIGTRTGKILDLDLKVGFFFSFNFKLFLYFPVKIYRVIKFQKNFYVLLASQLWQLKQRKKVQEKY